MCNPSNIEALLWLAMGTYFAATAGLGLAILLSASFFAAAANIGVMALVIAAHGSSILFFSLALGELNDCPNTVCTADFDYIKTLLIIVITDLSIITGLLIALAVVAAIPIGGAIAAGPVLAKLVTVGVGAMALLMFLFSGAMGKYNDCRLMAGFSSFFSTGIMIMAILAALVSVAFVFAGIPKSSASLPPPTPPK